MEARCQCAAVIIYCPFDKPAQIYACHCTECRRQSGSVFGVSAVFPRFDFLQYQHEKFGEYVRKTSWARPKRCYFCKSCGSRLVHASDGDEQVIIKGGCLTGLSNEMMGGAVHIWTREAVTEIPPDVLAYEEEPPHDPSSK